MILRACIRSPAIQPSSAVEEAESSAVGEPGKRRKSQTFQTNEQRRPRNQLTSSQIPFCLGLECNSLQFPVLFQQDLDFALGLFELLATRCGKLHALFKQGQRLLKRRVALL